jgi:ribonuclease P protein component
MREAHVPAQQPEAIEEARLPLADADPRRPGGVEVPPPAGPQAPVRLIWRVRDRGTFEALGRAPARAAGPVRLRSVPTDPGEPRVAYAVGRSVGNAVERNRLRRRLRAVVRSRAALLRRDRAYLISAGPRAAAMTALELSAAVTQLLEQDSTS